MERDKDSSSCTASFCPSFSSYSGDRLAETADRVGREVAGESGDCQNSVNGCGGDNDEFEFVNLRTDSDAAEADSGDVGLIFPVFDQNLVSDRYGVGSDGENGEYSAAETVTTPLRDLFLRDRDGPPPPQSSSSSDDEDDELVGIPSEIYCSWTPARSTAEMSPSGGCRKSNSTGSSSTSTWSVKRWRIRDLLRRSRSDGKQSLVFIDSNPAKSNGGSSKEMKKKEKVSAHERFYLRNKAMKEEDKRKSYLPYKQDLVGLFTNIGGYGKTFPPF